MSTTRYVTGGDWGTSHLRLYWIDRQTGTIVDSVACDHGVKSLAGKPDAFASTLTEQCQRLLRKVNATVAPQPILISGMASSSVGWQELPYGKLPFKLTGEDLPRATVTAADGVQATLFSGVAAEADVMRGEECECIGLHSLLGADAPEAYGVVLPGTHSKHATIEKGRMTHFSTFFGGELFAILAEHSILRLSLQENGTLAVGEDEQSFISGVETGARENLLGQLFKVRAQSLLNNATPLQCREWLNGLLIGSELGNWHAADPGRPVYCLGNARLRKYYSLAARCLNFTQWQDLSDSQMLTIRARVYSTLAG